MRFFRVIDCTGDADIAYMAGAEYRKTGEKETNHNKQNNKQANRCNKQTNKQTDSTMKTLLLTIILTFA